MSSIVGPSGSVGKAGAGSAGPGSGHVAGFGNRGGEGGQVRISVEYRRVCDYLCPVQESETVLHKRQRDNVTCAEHVTRGPPASRLSVFCNQNGHARGVRRRPSVPYSVPIHPSRLVIIHPKLSRACNPILQAEFCQISVMFIPQLSSVTLALFPAGGWAGLARLGTDTRQTRDRH